MILASHGIFTAYGFWLPNDPRGFWSDFVRRWNLLRFGNATQTDERKSVAGARHDRRDRLAAKTALKFTPVRFTGVQARAVARGFATAIESSGYRLCACAILRDHIHIVVDRHEQTVERIIGHLKSRAAHQLAVEGLHPFSELAGADGRFPSVWAHRAWKVFLNSEKDIERAIKYVEGNPAKEGLRSQRWWFARV